MALIPEGFLADRVTTLYDAEGDARLRWVRANRERAKHEEAAQLAIEAFQARAASTAPLPPIDVPKLDLTPDLLNVIPIGDPHLGQLSWAPETGDNFDLRIAEAEFGLFVDLLFDRAPPALGCVVLSLGDLFHAHDDTARTKRSGHVLDVDGRNPKIFEAGAEIIIRTIRRALETHLWVAFRSLVGNHDDFLAYAVAAVVREHFRDNPRVWVDCDPSAWWWLEFGECLLGGTHGHTCKADRMRDAMIVDKAEAWGRTKYRHMYVGHVHHNSRLELAGLTVEYMRNTAPRDAHAAAGGYRSRNDLRCDTWHRAQGLIASSTVPRELVKSLRGQP